MVLPDDWDFTKPFDSILVATLSIFCGGKLEKHKGDFKNGNPKYLQKLQ